MVADATKELVALAIVSGAPPEAIEREYGLTPAGVRSLLTSKDMKQRLARLQKELETNVQLMRSRVMFEWPVIVEEWLRIAKQPGRSQLAAIQSLAERLWPAKVLIEGELGVNVSSEDLRSFTEALVAAKASLGSPSERRAPRLLRGENALVRADLEARDSGSGESAA